MSKQNQNATFELGLWSGLVFDTAAEGNSEFDSFFGHFSILLSLQKSLNHELMMNNMLTAEFFKGKSEQKGKSLSSEGSTIPGKNEISPPHQNQKRPSELNFQQKNQKVKKWNKKIVSDPESQYEPSQQQQINLQYKLSESKNVPKNYGKSIIAFAKKQQQFTKSLLQTFLFNFGEFDQFLNRQKDKINTIAQLRALWIESQNNPFAKILRILTSKYLRKHSYSHIFNSRVENYAKHLKYRQKILKAIEKPQNFTQMKDY